MSADNLKHTAFNEVQVEAGAAWTDWEGWAWAADFGDPVAEHQATRTACNTWDESPLRKWDLRGPDALALADALFTNDMSALELGQVRYGAICDEQGKMIMDGTVFHLGEGHCLSITSYDSDLAWFRQVAADRKLDVEIARPNRRDAPPPGPGTEGARRPAADHRGRRRRRAALLPVRHRGRQHRRACRAGCRARATRASSVSRSTAPPVTPPRSGTR